MWVNLTLEGSRQEGLGSGHEQEFTIWVNLASDWSHW
ncbi:hypothetical protein KC19_1G192000 [Ceratodon purpureus]|uniref:Uncharacterized protein n=1 Tax=Ceratodon purpureus TaxID=3225 RepID=A0A8T0J825_CERPU|nr:hypothetical protein KC19_1G192000 [Ceratodon purpureus]